MGMDVMPLDDSIHADVIVVADLDESKARRFSNRHNGSTVVKITDLLESDLAAFARKIE